MSIRLKLLTILPKLMALGLRVYGDLIKELPDVTSRSAILRLYDTAGNELAFYLGFEGERPTVKEVNPRNPPYATTEISMHIDTFIKVLKGRLDFRSAYLYDLIDIRSHDGLPPTYHFILWAAFFDRIVKVLRG